MAQAGVAYVEIKPDWAGFNREVSRQAPSLDRQFTQMGGQLAGSLSRGLTGAGKAAGLKFAHGASLGVKVGAAGIAGGLAYAVKKASDFEQQVSALGSVSRASAKQMEQLRKSAITAGAATKFSALDAAKAQTELAKGGLTTKQILSGGLDSALALAAAGELDLADAATTTVNSMKLFRIQGKDSIKVADALATAANSTTADVSDFSLALNQAGSAAKTVGLSFPETITALEALAEVGIKGSDAGTSLKTALVQLASPTSEKAIDTARELGINVFDAHGNIKSLVDVSKELQSGLGGLTKEQRISAATTLVGQDGFRALLALYDAGPEKIKRLEGELNKQGTAAEVAKKKQDNLKGSLEQLGGSAETFGISVGTLMIPAIRDGADELTDFTNDLNKIASNDKLDIGEKISKSFELIKLRVDPLIAKLKTAIIDADIPGAIGDILSRGSDRIGEGVHVGSEFTDKLLAQVKAANLPEKIGDLISQVTPIIKALAGAGLLAANAFAEAFISADGWGKLALGAFLLSKMGGLGTLRKLGASAGLNFSTGFAAASAAGGVPIATGGGAAPGKRGPSAKSGLTPLLPIVGPGFTSGNPVNQNPKPGLTGPTRTERATNAARGAKGALSSGLNKVPILAAVTVPFIELEAEKRANAAEKAAEAAARAKDALLKAIPDPQKWKQFSDAIEIAKGTFSGTPEDFDAGTAALDRLGLSMDSTGRDVDKIAGVFDNLKGRFSVAQRLFAKGITLNPETTREEARVVADAIEKMSKGSSSSVKDLRTNVRLSTRAIKKSLGDDTAEGKEALAANFRAAVQNIKTSMDEGKIKTAEGTAEIERLMVAALSQFGFSKKQALNIAKTGDADGNKGREGGASSVIKKARGGHITGGMPVGDSVPALLERDEYVLNRKAVKKIGRRALDAVNFGAAPRFQVGGMVSRFAAGGSVTGDTDFVPALMDALKRLSAAAGQSIFVQSGRRTVAEQLAQGPSTPGHPVAGPNGPHVRGVAADITPGYPAFGALAGKFGLGFTVMPQEPWHIQLLDAAKAAGAAAVSDFNAPDLKRLLVDGPDSPLKSVVQGSLDTVRGAAQEVVSRAAASAASANGSEANFTPGSGGGAPVTGSLADVDHVFPRHNLGQPGVQLAPDLVAKIAESQGLPGRTFEQIAHGESDYHPGIIGHDPGGTLGYGLFQNTTGVNGAAFEAVINRLGGWAQQLNPIKNAAASKWLYDRGGIGHWYGTKYVTGGGEQTKGGRFQGGGLVDSVMRLAKGGATGDRKKKLAADRKQQVAWMQGIWGQVAPLLGQNPGTRVPSLFKHLSLNRNSPFVGVAWDDKTQTGTPDLLWPRWVWKDTDGQKALDTQSKTQLFVHEMAHRFQKAKETNTTWKSEGGAEAFARRAMDSLFGGRVNIAGDPYNKYAKRVEKDKGADWIMNGQFGKTAQAVKAMLGGMIGLKSGGFPFPDLSGGAGVGAAAAAGGAGTKGPPKGRLPGGVDLGGALDKIKTGKTPKIKDAATKKLLDSISGIGFAAQSATLTRLLGNADLYGENADRASRLTDTNKIQDALEGELTRRQALSPLPSPLFPDAAQQEIVNGLLGRVGGGTQLDWLTQQLSSLFDWRNVITDTDPLVTQLRDDTASLLKDAEKRLATVVAEIKKAESEIKKKETERDRKSKHEETLKRQIGEEMDKSPKKRDQKKLKGWRADLAETHAEHVALNQQLSTLRGDNRGRARVQDDLTDSIIPALTDKRDSLEDSHGTLLENLIDVQGLGGPTTRLAALPPIGALGGRLFDVQSLRQDLTDNPPRIEATVPAQSENDKARADLLQGLLDESHLRTSVSESAFDVFKSFPYGGAFKDGGIIPGPVGSPVMILGHGGEEVIPVGDTNGGGSRVRVVMEDHRTRVFVDDVEQVVQSVTRRQARTAARGLPGIGGGNIR